MAKNRYPTKTSDAIHIRHTIQGKSATQNEYLNALRTKSVVMCTGPAGCGKTYLVTAVAIEKLLAGEVQKIIITRPVVEAGENLGFLPGTLEEKLAPYLIPVIDAFHAHIGPTKTTELLKSGKIEIAPLAYMRGRNLEDAFVLLDEGQNATKEQLRMFITRMSFGSTFVINGDSTQTDLNKRDAGGLSWMVERLRGASDDIATIEFGYKDIMRHPLIATILNRLDVLDLADLPIAEVTPLSKIRVNGNAGSQAAILHAPIPANG